jgi:predicted Zn finger-like uncharacterized protein
VIIQCPYCATRYQLDAARLTGPHPLFKCSRCRQVFPSPSSKRKSSGPPPTAPPSIQENLTLPFEDSSWKTEAEALPADDFELLEPEERFTLGSDDQPAVPAAPHLPAQAGARLRAGRRTVPRTGDVTPASKDERRRNRGKVRAIFVFLGLVVAGYAVLMRALFASPALCDKLLNSVPLIGTLGDERLLTRKVALSDVVGSYQRIKDGKEVFVITGKALNTATLALHGVQIAGKLYDSAGQTVDQKTIYCGNVISVKVLKDLSPNELSILQKLNPPKRFMIEPGGLSTFVIVFMDPPHDVVEFSINVAAAQRQA